MKTGFKLILPLLTTITAISLPLLVKAQPNSVSTPSTSCVGEVPAYISPANLAMMAYQGYLEKQGIPGYQVLATEYSFGHITAAQIVEAAIKGCLLSNKYGVPTDNNYVQDLAMQVQILFQENR
jgi:hypothetical protein